MNEDFQKQLPVEQGWKLLESSPELLLALRERPEGLFGDLSQLQPSGAVLAGDLSEMQPSDLLNFLHQGRRTGVLLTREGEIERGLAMTDGNVAWACSTSHSERLGELLCRMGLADRPRVDAAIRAQGLQGQHRRLGQILVEQGLIAPDQLLRGLRHQTVEIFLGLLVAQKGSFVFLRGLDRARLPATLNLDTQGLLLDGLRRLDEMELYRTIIPDSGVTLRPSDLPLPRHHDEITEEARAVYALADGSRTLAELAVATALGEFEATRAAYKLVGLGFLEIDR